MPSDQDGYVSGIVHFENKSPVADQASRLAISFTTSPPRSEDHRRYLREYYVAFDDAVKTMPKVKVVDENGNEVEPPVYVPPKPIQIDL